MVHEASELLQAQQKTLVLIVDDSATMRLLLAEAMSDAGFESLVVENGEEALEVLKTTQPDAILLDVEMPGLNGFAVCAEIRKMVHFRYTPIMMVTGLEDYESINKAFLAGATDFTTKPINAALLGHRVRYMVRTSAYFRDLQAVELKVRELNTELEKKILEIQQIAEAQARFVPQDFLRLLNKESIVHVNLGDNVEKNMSVLFLDIRSFTELADHASPVEIFSFLNELMSYLEPAIVKNNGFIDKYIGDAIMALFNRRPDDALQASVDMHGFLKKYNETRTHKGLQPVRIGIGINTGMLVLGTVGYEDRMDCTVISDTVNVASRIESQTKVLGVDVLITEETFKQLHHPERFHLRSLGSVQVKGKVEPINIYEVFNHNPELEVQAKLAYQAIFAEALIYYQQKRYLEASSLFRQVISKNSRDLPAEYFLQQCQFKSNAFSPGLK
ncbi:adenylate/guanylate cyclase domain-containing protein [Legionella septentrionalis]|uniref:Adenylate/guanylate cyclase domain-containing response regulator n=1 Tax=Legionella septentrionalis TaxID=2498109 RepID=A0A3S0WSB4_9GAMM|nr:adenylate/guanylate cyclase domain-containing protein [Legionella septentrionalis]RUQ89261.1 adenylate/guanylate cyclase domain-containing response regulator [Legionella septentrionalis]RUQ94339.1 adenylate/guanylate cyclase domain-containing response regulator [Legionella septentrionalis]RUR11704.1 adenylate/guanylate cyclase domain-containing response regulator [Legionella septentrionalis]RUR17392.1 adenylate/guanylate cyclase domain-containing response regulator [Legionella septentrionali